MQILLDGNKLPETICGTSTKDDPCKIFFFKLIEFKIIEY